MKEHEQRKVDLQMMEFRVLIDVFSDGVVADLSLEIRTATA